MAGRKTLAWVLATGAVLALGACNGANPFGGGTDAEAAEGTATATEGAPAAAGAP